MWYKINPTSMLIGESGGVSVVVTGGWYDVYIGRHHVTGSASLAVAFAYLVPLNPRT